MALTTEDERTGLSATGAGTATQAPPGAARESVLRNREFRGVVMAQATSECGDQIAAIAISLLVYGRSNSPFLAAATYAVTYVPWVFGSIVLSPLADRFPRRNVMLTCDAGRAVVISLLALASFVHGMPIGALIALVLLSSFFSPPFSSARGATLPDIFESGSRYVRAVAISRILQQVDQVFGFALGGLVVAAVTPRGALALDALTFVASYGLIHTHLSLRPPADGRGRPTISSLLRGAIPDLAIVWRHPARRALLMFSAFSLIFLIAPDSLAVAYARQHGHGAVVAGILAASQPLGVALGAWAFIRFVPVQRQGRYLLPLGVVGATCLILTCVVPPIGVLCVLWVGSGLAQAFLVATIAAYNVVTERALRGRANGLAAATIAVTQGVGFLLWGAVAEWRGAAAGVAWAGITGLLIMAVARYLWPNEVIDGAWARLASAHDEH